ncbi:unnamed protein product [Peronospora belbahrii]|uniref:Uncharacterized protein n=1 Tax=Peronospora belbahrii TaxID=622444 RepID=A0AAU9KRW4_9STRA|nr:unnamed protein product [Peronospora belbahrii]
MTSKDHALAKLRARMAEPPKDWTDALTIKILKDPIYYGMLSVGIFFVLALIALFATKKLLDQIAMEEKQKQR